MTSLEDLEFKAKNELLEMGDTYWEKEHHEQQQQADSENDFEYPNAQEQSSSRSPGKMHFWGQHIKQKSEKATTITQTIIRKTSLGNLPEFCLQRGKILTSSCSITRAVSPREKEEIISNTKLFARKPCNYAYDPFNLDSTKNHNNNNNNNKKNLEAIIPNKDGIQHNNSCNQYSFLKNPVMYYLRQKRKSINCFKTLQDTQHEQNSLSRASKEIIQHQQQMKIMQEQSQQQLDSLQSFQQQSYLKAIQNSISNPKKAATHSSSIIIKDKTKRLFGDRSKSVMESYRDKDKEKTIEREKQLTYGEGQTSYLQKINDLLARNREIQGVAKVQNSAQHENHQDKKNINNSVVSKINLNSQLQTIPVLFPTNNNNKNSNNNNNKSCLLLGTVGAVAAVDARFVRLPQTRGFLKSQQGMNKEDKIQTVISISKSVLKNRQEDKFQKQQEFSKIVLESIQQAKNPIERIQQLKGIIQQQLSMKQHRKSQNISTQPARIDQGCERERNNCFKAAFFVESERGKTQSLDYQQEEHNLSKVSGNMNNPQVSQEILQISIKKSEEFSQVSLEQLKNQKLISSCFQMKNQGVMKQIPLVKSCQKRQEVNHGDTVFSNSMLQRRNQGNF